MNKKMNCFYCGYDNHPTRDCPTKEVMLSVLKMDLDKLYDLIAKHEPKPEDYSFVSHFYSIEHLIKHFVQEKDRDILTGKSWATPQKVISEAHDYYLSALEFYRKGDLISAFRLCLLSQQGNSHDFRTHTVMGYLRMEREEYKEAKLSFQYAIQNVNHNYYKALGTLFLSRFYSSYSNYAEALRLVKIAIDGCPSIEEAHYIQATLCAQLGDNEGAFKAMNKVLQFNSGYYAGLCLDREFHLIKPFLCDYLTRKIKNIREISEQLAKDAAQNINDAQKKKAEFYDPVEFKAAHSRLNLSRHRLNKDDLFSILEAERLIKDGSGLAFKAKTTSTIKSTTAIKRLLNIRRRTKKANFWTSSVIGIIAAFAGLFFGTAHNWFRGPEDSYPVYLYAVLFFIITFIGVAVSNLMYYSMWEGKIFGKIRDESRDMEILPNAQQGDASTEAGVPDTLQTQD
jgi:tetratricopeptide (TPR) repeat protein